MPLFQSSRNWLIKYRLYHIPFWVLYNYIWWAIIIGHPIGAIRDITLTPFGIKFGFYVVSQILAIYFNLYYLTPRWLERRKYAIYISLLALTILGASFLIIPGYYLTAMASGKDVRQIYGPDAGWYHFLGNALSSTLGCMTLAMSIKLAKNWIQTQKREQMLEKEKLETELNFLKYQFNPHFLFNTINSIFFLIHKNPAMASASLAKFSDLLRYQLYECDEKQIPLRHEIAYLENFVELEKLRQNHNMEITLELDRSSANDWEIAPFILMTFVENAFKHVSKHADQPNCIHISLSQRKQELHFVVTNTISDHASVDVVHYGGIGLKNVQRRLDLIYPGQYALDIERSRGSFQIRFRLSRVGQAEIVNTLQKTALAG